MKIPFDKMLSQLLGTLAETKLPKPLLKAFLQQYIAYYKVNSKEIEQPLESFASFQDFFTRSLPAGARPLVDDPATIIAPVDGTLSEFGVIENGKMMQAKAKSYQLEDLVGKEQAPFFENGLYATLYLSPKNYHRFHSPFAGILKEGVYFPGDLNPVNAYGVEKVEQLFCKNERFLLFIETNYGRIGMLMVGALVVGKIVLNFHAGRFQPGINRWDPPFSIVKGEELGCFKLGSTVILLFPAGVCNFNLLEKGQELQLGMQLGRWVERL